ncbi:MAG: HU-CCDC81 and SPOR domain-containing protein [Bacteroidetes bacterium]|nr:HU-CCDC81 and SPOR domain-containing protein [Bacteroidota bacterium]
MNLEKHISELLFEHDCVIVPDFGGFVCNYSSANIHSAKHQFHPPFKKISFNRNLKNNDGLLANQVAQSENISYSDSNRCISEYVKMLNKELSKEKRFDLKNIGTIYLGEENTLLFEQDETVNYLPDSFGLSTFYSPAIRREPIERKIEKKLKDKVIIPSKEKEVASTTLSVTNVKRKISRYVVYSTAVVVIAFLLWIPFQTGLLKNIDYSSLNPFAAKGEPLYQLSEVSLPEKDIAKENAGNLFASENDTIRFLNIAIDGKTPIVVSLQDDKTAVAKTKSMRHKTNGRFQIIGGAFAIAANAEKFVAKLKTLGYDAQIINKKLHMVSYGSFASRKEAREAMEKIHAVQKDAWLMRN